MATRPLTDHEYRINGNEWIACDNSNTLDNENGTYTIFEGLQENIPIGGLEVRVKSINGFPPSEVLVNNSEFTATLPLDNTILDPESVSNLLYYGLSDSENNDIVSGKVATLANNNGSLGDLSQSDESKRPVFMNNGGLNNLPYMSFSTGIKISLPSISVSMPLTIYMVLKQNSFGDGKTILDFGSGFTSGIVQKLISGVNSLSLVNNLNWVPASKNYYKQKWSLFCFVFNGNQSTLGADKEPLLKRKGESPGNSAMTTLSIGGDNNPSFDVMALAVYNTTLTDQQDLRIGNFFKQKYNFLTDTYVISLGDSITEGYNSTNMETQSYVALVCNGLNADMLNYGISGTTVNSPTDSNSLMNIYQNLQFLKTNTGYLTFCYGTNDFIDEQWKIDYKNVISYFITYGFDKSKTVIISPPYQSNKETKLELALSYIEEISNELDILFADCYTFTKNNGGDSLLTDGTHPNNLGHQYMSEVILSAINA